MRIMQKVLLTFAVLSLPVSTLAAAPYKYMTRTNGNQAIAQWDDVNGNTETYTFLIADVSDQGAFVAISQCNTDLNTFTVSCLFGFASPSANVFSTDKKLSTATLSPVQVDLYDDSFSYVKTVTVQASWTGQGKSTKSLTNVHAKYDSFQETYRNRATARDATATGSIDGTSIAGLEDGYLVQYRSADFFMVK